MNGIVIEVPSEKLSAEDLRYVENMSSRGGSASRSGGDEDDEPLSKRRQSAQTVSALTKSLSVDNSMSRVPSTSTTSTNFETIFTAALKVYKKQTTKDLASHPLATQLQSCDSSSAILTILRTQVETFDQSQSADEKWTKWLNPTVNVLFAFSATLGNGVGVVSCEMSSHSRSTL